MAANALDQYRKAMEHAEGIRQAAVEELRAAINTQITELNSFGFDFRLTRGAGNHTTRTRTPTTRPKHCEICNIAGHDKRNHRNQEPVKKFTRAELEAKGLPLPEKAQAAA